MSVWAATKNLNLISDKKQIYGLNNLVNIGEEDLRNVESPASINNERVGQAETISNPQNSSDNFNLQRINCDILAKDISKRQSAMNSNLASAQRRGNHHQKSSADFAMSGDFCEWGLSPEGGAGSSMHK